MTTETKYTKVIEGPAGHWYALVEFEGKPTLIGMPIDASGRGLPFESGKPPKHPQAGGSYEDGWYDITDPVPETDDAALIAELLRLETA